MKLKNKFNSQKGAMDKIIVTLLLVVIGVIGVIGIEQWSNSKKNEILDKANTTLTNVLTEINSNN
jgi:hypothetical protein